MLKQRDIGYNTLIIKYIEKWYMHCILIRCFMKIYVDGKMLAN